MLELNSTQVGATGNDIDPPFTPHTLLLPLLLCARTMHPVKTAHHTSDFTPRPPVILPCDSGSGTTLGKDAERLTVGLCNRV